MANGGAFGNPLTTGIALNFEVDMTPYRQMMQDNLQFAQTQAAERKKKEKEFQDILKNIAYDDSKIHTRMRDDARVEYAATIEDVMELKKKNDFGGIMNRIAKFDSKLNNYVDATANFRAYEKALEDGKSWVDMDYVNAFNNPDKFDDRYLIDNFSDVAIYDKEAGVFSAQAIPKQDEVAFVNNYMQGMKDQFMRDDEGKIKRSGFLSETGDYAYLKSKSADPESFYQELGIAWLGGGRNNIEHMRRKMGLKPEDLEGSIDTSSGPVAKSVYHATEFMKRVAEPKMYSEELRRPAKEGESKGWSGGKSENWNVSKTDRPVDLGKEVGDLYGYDVFYTGDKAKEVSRVIQVSQGSYWAKGGDEFLKVSDKAEGEGVGVPAIPSGLYIRKDKPKGEGVWAAYRTPYEPPALRGETEAPEGVDPDVWASLGSGEDVDWTKTQSYRTIYVPIKSKSEANAFMSTLNMPKEEYDRLIKDVEKEMGTTSGTQSSESEAKKESKRVEVTQQQLDEAANARGMSINDYKSQLKKNGIEVIVK